ncbi:DNA ligase D [Aequorivita sp. H23M31]|uniref:DNA ligase (ATP) n=1 Tax=Aequorivita ciconiae TaxID=2494375 RepID=A0A410G0W6_9FLAO|nr:DNA ligase D [Aequorivita sp. H23M31]QAA80907.1 DNA ligase D [Aequorivita sp. H23M31]
MALDKYKKKRDPKITPEPFGGKSEKDVLRFVVQKHAASHLHYDFRLEMEGVLKSWAVPKGPSTDPQVKRLAMMVEDHPYDYRNFEGIIPQGEYGGGTVIVWDEGTYEPADFDGKTKEEKDKHLLKELESGKLKFILKGKKLKGEYALVKVHGRGENGWLLMKLKDKYALEEDITKKDKSVISKKTIDQVAETSTNILGQSKKKESKASTKKDKIPKEDSKNKDNEAKEDSTKEIDTILKKAKKAKFPKSIKPMLATLVDEPFDDPDWSNEVKWDGYRSVAYIHNGDVNLSSRNNKSFSEKYYPITAALEKWNKDAVLDGEIVVIGKDGKADFSALQNWRSEADGNLVYYVFDLLWFDGKNIMDLPLNERQEVLKAILPTDDDHIHNSEAFITNGIEFFETAKEMKLEGIMAKRKNSRYSPGNRSKDWLKVKANLRQEVVIGGYTKNEDSPKPFSSLLLGVYEKAKLQYVGKVGTGFTVKKQKEMMEIFKPLVTSKSPFTTEPDVNQASRFRPDPPKAKATWLTPSLVCEVSFAEITKDGIFRHPSFKGLRTDKKAKDVVRETASDTEAVVAEEKDDKPKKQKKIIKIPKAKKRQTLLNPTEETQVKKINGHDLKFTNLSKVYWPEEGYTKRDMFNYYYQIAEYILPYLKDRPLSLYRFPNGIHGKSFYQKDVKGKAPDWAITYPYTTSDGEDKEFLVGEKEDTLLWAASLGCIEMNPWFSTIHTPDNPDYCVIDLDPAEKTSFDQVIEAAQEVKKVLDEMKVPGYAKTSGSTGIHIYIPLDGNYTYDESQMFAKLIASIVQQRLPKFTSIERYTKNRDGKMYIDYLQNRPGATIAAPYSLRPKVGATVSMPLHWEEIKKGLKMKDFDIKNSVARVREKGDIFRPILKKGINMEDALKNASKIS